MICNDVTGGPASRTLDPGIAAPFSRPPPTVQRLHRASAPAFRSQDLVLWMIIITRHHLVRYFPTNRAGASNPGDCGISYGTGKPSTARSTAAVRKGSPVKTMSPTASPRPQHRSTLLAGQPASLLLAKTYRIGVFSEIPIAAPQCPVRFSAAYAICGRRHPA